MMRRELLFAAIAASVAMPTPAFAFAPDPDRDDQLVCRRDRDRVFGSLQRAPRTCRTRAEWRELEEHTQRELQQIRDGQAPNEAPVSVLPGLDRPGPGPNRD